MLRAAIREGHQLRWQEVSDPSDGYGVVEPGFTETELFGLLGIVGFTLL